MKHPTPSLRKNLDQLGQFLVKEKSLLFLMLVYAIAVGLFSLIIPFTVQELVNTFAFAVTPIMVVTLVGIMAGMLLFVGLFKVLQFYATDILERRVFVRVILPLAYLLPRFQGKSFNTHSVSRFFETVFLQRAISNLLVDLINVLVGGLVGMTLLAVYHPYFLFFDSLLIVSIIFIALLGKGGLRNTLNMSKAKYDAFHWLQEIADNLLHFKATNSSNLVMRKTDCLAVEYVQARKFRFRILMRQYIGSLFFQVIMHAGLLGTAGWLLSQGELTLGQLVAAEVIIASLLLNLDSVVKRTYIVFYFFTALTELDLLFSQPQDTADDGSELHLPISDSAGLHVAVTKMNWASNTNEPSRNIQLQILPGEKWALICPTESIRFRVSLALAGLEQPPEGVIKYNGVDLRSLSMEQINTHRGILFGRDLSLFEGSLKDNITMGRPNIATEDMMWALELAHLDNEIENFAEGLETQVHDGGKKFTHSQRVRVLLARAILARPSLLILDGGMHEVPREIREPLLHRLSSDEYPWTLIIVTTDLRIEPITEKSMVFAKAST